MLGTILEGKVRELLAKDCRQHTTALERKQLASKARCGQILIYAFLDLAPPVSFSSFQPLSLFMAGI